MLIAIETRRTIGTALFVQIGESLRLKAITFVQVLTL